MRVSNGSWVRRPSLHMVGALLWLTCCNVQIVSHESISFSNLGIIHWWSHCVEKGALSSQKTSRARD